MVKVTFTLDEETVAKLTEAAARHQIPKSQVVREAIDDFSAKDVPVPEAERRRKMDALREFLKTPSSRSSADVDRELRELRESRRRGWTRPGDRR